MSVSPPSSISPLGNRYFDALPNDTVELVFEFLRGDKDSLPLNGDDKSIIATSRVCKEWRNNATLAAERAQAAPRLHQRIYLKDVHRQILIEGEYPQGLRQLFQRSNQPIRTLPILDLGNHNSDYIDFLMPADLSSPVMRFKDIFNRPGIALHLQPKTRENPGVVLALFQRSSDDPGTWEYGERDNFGILWPTITAGWSNRMNENVRALEHLSQLLRNEHSTLMIPMPAPQPNNPAPQEVPAPQPNHPQPQELPAPQPNRLLPGKVVIITAVAAAVLAYLAEAYLRENSYH